MTIRDGIEMTGSLTLRKVDRGGRIVEEVTAENAIVLSGRDLVAKQFINEHVNPISHLAVGTGTTVVNPGTDVALAHELYRKPINPMTYAQNVTTTSENKRKVTITADLDFSQGNGALTEAGLFNAAGAGTGIMYNRVVFPPVNKTSDFKLTLIWEVVF